MAEHFGQSGGEPVSGALLRYRIMAYTVGVGLIILVFVGVPLQFGANAPGVVKIVGPIHGALYIIYLITAADLARRARFRLLQLAVMIAAGFVPFLAFVVERHVVRRLGDEIGEDAALRASDAVVNE